MFSRQDGSICIPISSDLPGSVVRLGAKAFERWCACSYKKKKKSIQLQEGSGTYLVTPGGAALAALPPGPRMAGEAHGPPQYGLLVRPPTPHPPQARVHVL